MNDHRNTLDAYGRDRRFFLRGVGLASLPLVYPGWALPGLLAGKDTGSPKLIPRKKNPDNLEFPFHTLDSFITPNELFYVRTHYNVPRLDTKTWRLRIEGAVTKPVELTYKQLLALPTQTRAITMECAGNGRSFLDPRVGGVQWARGAISTARWTGVPLAAVLDRVGLRKGAVHVILEGADQGKSTKSMAPPGVLSYARSVPLEKARKKDEVLLAFKMNGVDLPADHGFPVRAVVGGWYGMASVKWLTRIIVTDRPFHGYDQTVDYAIWEQRHGLPTLVPLGGMAVKASIARPTNDEVIPANKTYRIHGAAWAGEHQVKKVEVSTDGGKNWSVAKLLGKPTPLCWRLWEFTWKNPFPGKHTLLARAMDDQGRTQPLTRDRGRRSYMINHLVPTSVMCQE